MAQACNSASAAKRCPFHGRVNRRALAGLLALLLLAEAGCGRRDGGLADAGNVTREASAKQSEPRDPDHPVVEIDTSVGTIRVKLDAINSPSTVRNFLYYVMQGFYDDTLIHYVDADKMILGGGYTADRQPKPVGTTVRNEAHNGLKNVRGTIAMARDAAAGIDTATTQFFINLADAPSLNHRGDEAGDYGYCVFGEVVDGLNVAEEISRSTTSDHGGDLAKTPDPAVVVKSIRIAE